MPLLTNAAPAVYQVNKITKLKLNPLKNENYRNTKPYQKVLSENKGIQVL